MKRNHSLLEDTRDKDTQVSKIGPCGPSVLFSLNLDISNFVIGRQGKIKLDISKVPPLCKLD